MRRPLALALVALSMAATSRAQTSPVDLVRQAQARYEARAWDEAAAGFEAALRAGFSNAMVAYGAACSFALAGKPDAAFRMLREALRLGFNDAALLQRDTDLVSLHADPRWTEAVAATQRRKRLDQMRWDGDALATPYRPVLSTAEKAAGLSTLWSEARFNFANFDLVPDLNWDSLYVATLPRAMAAPTTEAYYRVLMETVAKLRDGHCNVFPSDTLADRFYSRPPLLTRRFGERVAVVAVYDPALERQGIVPGVEVVTVDGEAVDAYAQRVVAPLVSVSTEQDRVDRVYGRQLLRGAPGPVRIRFRRADGRTFERTLFRQTAEERRASGASARAARPAFRWRMLPGRVAYVELNSFETNEAAERFQAAFDSLRSASALVFDVRENGGGNSGVGWNVLAHLTSRPFRTSAWRTLRYEPAYRAWGQGTSSTGDTTGTMAPATDRPFAGPVAVLTSPRTFSAAEDFAVAFDAMDRGSIVGEPTGGSTGQPLFFRLPGGGSARITSKRDTYPDGRDFVGRGVQPDVRVAPTLDDLRAGRDPVLEAALRVLREHR